MFVLSKAEPGERRSTIEPVFGLIKDARGASRFCRRGLTTARPNGNSSAVARQRRAGHVVARSSWRWTSARACKCWKPRHRSQRPAGRWFVLIADSEVSRGFVNKTSRIDRAGPEIGCAATAARVGPWSTVWTVGRASKTSHQDPANGTPAVWGGIAWAAGIEPEAAEWSRAETRILVLVGRTRRASACRWFSKLL